MQLLQFLDARHSNKDETSSAKRGGGRAHLKLHQKMIETKLKELKLLIVLQLVALPRERFSPSSDMKAFIKSFHMRI